MKKKRHLAPFALALAVGMAASPTAALTNGVDWASAPSVVAYLDALVEERGKAMNVRPEDLTNIVVSADALWAECLDFELNTNGWLEAARFLKKRDNTTIVIANLPTFHRDWATYTATTNALEKLKPLVYLDVGRAPPQARAPFLIAAIKPEDSEELKAWKRMVAEEGTNKYLRMKANYENHLKYRQFHDALWEFYNGLDFMVRHSF